MTIYPAIDLRGGRCVRLLQGRADEETIYHDDPSVPAQRWKDADTEWLHLVDLDGAFEGASANLESVRSILNLGGMQAQFGGGLRDEEAVRTVLDAGVSRAIIGTRACTEPEWTSELVECFGPERIAVGIDARGFIFAAAVADRLKAGFVPIRKKGKLPAEVVTHEYELEYGTDALEIHTDAIERGESVLLVDDLLATGGTAEAATNLIEKIGGEVKACCFVVDLPDVGGRARLKKLGYNVFSLCAFEGE